MFALFVKFKIAGRIESMVFIETLLKNGRRGDYFVSVLVLEEWKIMAFSFEPKCRLRESDCAAD